MFLLKMAWQFPDILGIRRSGRAGAGGGCVAGHIARSVPDVGPAATQMVTRISSADLVQRAVVDYSDVSPEPD